METLNDTEWDVVISGTGLPQSLLALALSRSGKKILHVDRNDYYGGDEAALSLSEAETWAQKHAGLSDPAATSFSHAFVTKSALADNASTQSKLSHARAYSLALAPQLLYTRSPLLPALVSSKTDNQLEFQAAGSWFILNAHLTGSTLQPGLSRVPGGREDIFQDNTLDLKAKRALMKFLRFVTNYEEQADIWQEQRRQPFSSFLQEKFGLPPASHTPILALALSSQPMENTTVESALPRVARHLTSIGLFGPGFAAVLPKWGGLAEISQVACRACAVGGGVYVLGKSVVDTQADEAPKLSMHLTDGEKISTRWLVGVEQELPHSGPSRDVDDREASLVSKSVSIISSALLSLFPPTSEGGPTPAGAVVLVEGRSDSEPPVHIFVHSSESGECPHGQSIIYASVSQPSEQGFGRLERAVDSLLQAFSEQVVPQILWRLQYQQRFASSTALDTSGYVLHLRSLSSDLTFTDHVLEDVKAVWQRITEADPESFMKFEAREGTMAEEEDFR